ncbi:MAG TPA: TIGR03984 family CRISPR-associated protein [Cyanobacteria bacterium UBA8803]|nr:TIGR03984 family CRISPR-associated protein [Cyanobacteria bacterium UBA9273]HBL58318.1 TIGR03984 family CRISPR-associated protein [Cyanobacteria bacterium UBA8803]
MNQELCQISVANLTEQSLKDWLKQQAQNQNYQFPYLLAHAEDGVIWGHFDIDSGTLTTAREVFPECNFPELRLKTLQQCRVFGEAGEFLLWNSNGEWRSRLILQSKVSELIAQEQIGLIPEPQILWGTHGKTNSNFTLLSDGSQGLKHAVPIDIEESYFSQDKTKLYRPVRLEVNHYFCYDSDGVARIFISRLVSLKKEKI